MPDVTPSGLFSLPLTRLQTLIAASDAFQTWTGTANATEAAARVHLIEAPLVGDNAVNFPCVTIWPGDAHELRRVAGGARNHFIDAGSVIAWFEAAITADYQNDPRNAHLEFMNNVGAVLEDLIALAGSDTYLNVTEIGLDYGPSETDERLRESKGHKIACAWKFVWERI